MEQTLLQILHFIQLMPVALGLFWGAVLFLIVLVLYRAGSKR